MLVNGPAKMVEPASPRRNSSSSSSSLPARLDDRITKDPLVLIFLPLFLPLRPRRATDAPRSPDDTSSTLCSCFGGCSASSSKTLPSAPPLALSLERSVAQLFSPRTLQSVDIDRVREAQSPR